MKKISWKSFTSGILVGSLFFSSMSFAAPTVVKLFVNGKAVQSEVPPQIIDGSTLIPARALAEALGAKVEWDAVKQTVIVKSEPYSQLSSKEAGALSPQAAVYLTGLAKEHYWHLSIGGGLFEGESRTVKVKGKEYDYRWLGADLDTKAKYIAYLEEVFTPEQAASFWKKQLDDGSIVEMNGKLAQPNADGGSLLNWSQSTAKLSGNGDKQKTFQFNVPLGDGEADYEEREIKLRFVDGIGWRLDEPVPDVR